MVQAVWQKVASADHHPLLRAIVLSYASVGGVAAAGLIAVFAVRPTGLVVQRVAAPAPAAVSTARPALTGALPAPGARLAVGPQLAPQPALPVPATGPARDAIEPITAEEAEEAPMAVVEKVKETPAFRVVLPSPMLAPATAAASEVDAGEPPAAEPALPLEEVRSIAEGPAGMEAAGTAVKLLVPPPSLTLVETSAQVKARRDATNQAAIDAEKAARARAKAAADSANEAALQARKLTPTPSAPVEPARRAVTTSPTRATPSATRETQPTQQAVSANESAIAAARLATVQARARADAANHMASSAARSAARSPTPAPTASPRPAAPTRKAAP